MFKRFLTVVLTVAVIFVLPQQVSAKEKRCKAEHTPYSGKISIESEGRLMLRHNFGYIAGMIGHVKLPIAKNESVVDGAKNFFQENGEPFGFENAAAELRLRSLTPTVTGWHIKFDRLIGGLPLFNSTVQLTVWRADNGDGVHISSIQQTVPSNLELASMSAVISQGQAIEKALAGHQATKATVKRIAYSGSTMEGQCPDKTRIAYLVTFMDRGEDDPCCVVVDGNGNILLKYGGKIVD